MGLLIQVIKGVFVRAGEIKEENDYTIWGRGLSWELFKSGCLMMARGDFRRRSGGRVGITPAYLSILKNNKAKAIRFFHAGSNLLGSSFQPWRHLEFEEEQLMMDENQGQWKSTR